MPDYQVSPEFRREVLQLLPALADGEPDAAFRRAVLGYLMFSTFLEEKTQRLVLPASVTAEAWGVAPNNGRFRHAEAIARFEEMAFPLNVQDADYENGIATTVDPDFPEELNILLREENQRRRMRQRRGLVWFGSGEPISVRGHRRWLQQLQEDRLMQVQATPEDHPAWELLEVLNRGSVLPLKTLLRRNLDEVNRLVDSLPHETVEQRRYARYCGNAVADLVEDPRFLYKGVPNSARVFATSRSLHQLPRALRKAALRGARSMDLSTAQLAIAARCWGVRSLLEFLENGGDFWAELLNHLNLGVGSKQLLKTATYAITFGMGRGNYMRLLETGALDPGAVLREQGLGGVRAQAFVEHRLIRDLIRSRGREQRLIRRDGGRADAFGRWVPAEDGTHKVLARVAQSYEMRLMLAMLPVLRRDSVHVVSWLHDGLTVVLGERRRAERQVQLMQDLVNRAAQDAGIPTRLELVQPGD